MTYTSVEVRSNGGVVIGHGVVVFGGHVVVHTDVSAIGVDMDREEVVVTIARDGDVATTEGTLAVQEHRGGTVRFVGVSFADLTGGAAEPLGEDPAGEQEGIDDLLGLIQLWRESPFPPVGDGEAPAGDDPDGGDRPPLGAVRWICEIVFRGRC